jgi:hypothetical protein
MTQERTFTSRARRADKAEASPPVRLTIGTELPKLDDDGMEMTDENGTIYEITFQEAYTFHRPSDARMALMIGTFGVGNTIVDRMSEVMGTLRDMLNQEEFERLHDRIVTQDETRRVEIEDLGEILIELLSAWTEEEGFPTQQPPVSSEAPRRTGGNSTGRSPGRGSTRSSSR